MNAYRAKYEIRRTDGQPITGRTFTLELDTDPLAYIAIQAYANARSMAHGAEDPLAIELWTMASQLEEWWNIAAQDGRIHG